MEPHQTPAAEFSLVEYREAANAYFKGVDIGYTGLRSYITLNGLFAAVIAALAGPRGQSFAVGNELVKLIPVFALLGTVAIAVVIPHYFRHLENCRRRCQEIEESNNGTLFKRLGEIAHGGYKFKAVVVTSIIIISISTFWFYFAVKLWFLPSTINIGNCF